MPGTLYLVATPIGNLKDMTYRAVETLQAVDMVACEDTRHSLTLLNAYGIKKPLVAYHKFNERAESERLLAELEAGKSVALISDAGMPVISDPGNAVCRVLREAGEPFTVIPGANAALSALVLSAMPADRFAFIGFLPDKAGEKRRLLEKYKNLDLSLIFHVAPQDLDRDICAVYEVFGERDACAVREITKVHEEAVFFKLSQGFTGEARGEFVLIVAGASGENPLNGLTVEEHLSQYIAGGMDKKEAVKQVAKDRGVPKSEIYKIALKIE